MLPPSGRNRGARRLAGYDAIDGSEWTKTRIEPSAF